MMRRKEHKIFRVSILSVFVFVLLVSLQAQASMITLSKYVSDGPTPPAVADLYADLTFVVVGSELFVTVDNRTDETANQYSIAEVFFNAPDTLFDIASAGQGQDPGDGLVLTGLDIGGLGVWQKSTEYASDGFHINGFGYFDMYIRDGGQQVIGPGETATFTFTINGSESYTGEDFTSLFSVTDPATSMLMRAGAKFVQGPGDESGFGAVPEPATIALLGLGALALLRKRRA